LLYERLRYGVTLSPAKWAAIAVILALQAFLVLIPNEGTAAAVPEPTTASPSEAVLPAEQR
ncbi:MAG: hypothetical protein H0V00_13830, partial [Chloroflexia bacterium]|nr:hypothetical protein [Chloroflexia bacterium]